MAQAKYGLAMLLCGVAAIAAGQDTLLDELYGRGVHAYNSGKYTEAYDLLSSAIDAGTQDPRVYYFRGLAQKSLGRPDEAKADLKAGALLEAAGGDRDPNVGRALERVQGSLRLMIEDARRDGLLSKRGVDTTRERTRYEDLQQASGEVERGRVNNPILEVPEVKKPDPTDPFPSTGETLPPTPANPTPAPMPAPTPPPADPNDPFGNPPDPAPAPMPAPTPPPADPNDPFGNPPDPAPAPMPGPAPADPNNAPGPNFDPFAEGDAPMPGPGPAPAPMPAPGPADPNDPFGAAPMPEPGPAPAPMPADPNDPFGAAPATPAPAPGPVPAPAPATPPPADDPFGAAPATPAPAPGPVPAPAPATPPPADDPFGAAPATPAPAPAPATPPAADDPFGAAPATPAPAPGPVPAPAPATPPPADDPFGAAPATPAPGPVPAPMPAAPAASDPFTDDPLPAEDPEMKKEPAAAPATPPPADDPFGAAPAAAPAADDPFAAPAAAPVAAAAGDPEAALTALGVKCTHFLDMPSERIFRIEFPYDKPTDGLFAKAVPHLQKLPLTMVVVGPLTADELTELAKIKTLEDVSATGSMVTDADLLKLKPLANLKALNVIGSKTITEEGVRALFAEMPKLEVVYLKADEGIKR